MFKKKPNQKRTVGGTKKTSRDIDAARKARRGTRYVIPAGTKIEYKNIPLLQRFVTERGKIISRRITGISAKDQRAITDAVKKARFMGFLALPTLRRSPQFPVHREAA